MATQRPAPSATRSVLRWCRGAVGLAVAWLFTLLWWTPLLLLAALTLRRLPDRLVTGAIRAWARLALRLCGIRLKLDNASTLEGRQPRVVIINHQSLLDVAWFGAIMPPGSLALGKREIAYIPIINLAWWALRYVRVDRQHPQRGRRQLKAIPRLIAEQRRSLLIAPEGTRTPNGQLLPFKAGAFRFAMASGAPIHPVVVWDAFALLPRQRLIPMPGLLRVRFLDPVATDTWRQQDLPSHIEAIRSDMQEALADMAAHPDGARPRG